MSTNLPSRRYASAVFALVVALFVLGGLIFAHFLPAKTEHAAVAPPPPPATTSTAAVAAPTTPATTADAAPAKPEYLEVVGTVPLEGDKVEHDIVLFFNEPISIPAAEGQQAPAPFTLEPAVNGTFRVGPNYVAFRSDQLPWDQRIQVTLNDAIQGKSGKALNPAAKTFTFSRFAFEPQRSWTQEETDSHVVLGVMFPATVDPAKVQPNVTVKDPDGKDVKYTLTSGSEGRALMFDIAGNEKWPVTIGFGKGLSDTSGMLQMAEDKTITYPTETKLALKKVYWVSAEEGTQKIGLAFSKAVEPSAVTEHLKIKNTTSGEDQEFSMDTSDRGQEITVSLTMEDPSKANLAIEVSAGLHGAERSTLAEAAKETLAYTDLAKQEPLRIENQYWDGYGDRDGAKLDLSFSQSVNAQEVSKFLTMNPQLPNMKVEQSYNRNQVTIQGEWDSRKSYELIFKEGMKYGPGAKTTAAISRRVTAEQVPGYLGFSQEGKYYFPRRAGLPLAMESRNIKKVRLSTFRVFPSNIAVAVQDVNEGSPNAPFTQRWSEALSKTDIDVAYVKDRLVNTPIALDKSVPADKHGVFAFTAFDISNKTRAAESSEDESESDGNTYVGGGFSKIVVFTDIGLLSHWQDNSLVVFAHNLYSLAPLPMAKVTVYSQKNQVLATTNTDEQGTAKMGPFNAALGVPSVVIVELGDDYAFLELKKREDDVKEVTPDMPLFNRKAYDAFMYADRELYRPGETAHLRWVVRTNYGDALASVPLTLTINKPNGQQLLTEPVTLSALGTGTKDLTTAKGYPTGKYTALLKVPGSESAVGTYEFSLEEFVPNRMKAAVTVAEPRWLAGQEYSLTLNAQHLFGAPASERNCEAKVIVKPGEFAPEAWKAYTFGNDSTLKPDVVELGEAQTDEAGNAAFKFTYEPKPDATMPLQAVALGRVFELGGRAVSGIVNVPLFPSTICLGISATTAQSGKGAEVNVAAVNPDGTPAALASIKVTLEKQTWNYYVRRYYGNYESNWSESFAEVTTQDVTLTGGKGAASFNFDDWGYYRIRVHSDQTKMFSTLSFYSYGGHCNIVNPSRPSLIKLTLDKASYKVGEEAVVRIEAPFDGKGFVVLQGEEIQNLATVEIKGGVGATKFVMGREQYPNVWVEATVVHAIQEGKNQVYPFSSFAMLPIKVEDPQRTIAVAFPQLPQEIRPAQTVEFPIETRDGAGNPAAVEVTLAAVDEGIHLITGYKSPDPLGYLARMRRPDYRYAHYYDHVAYDFEKPAPGGDAEALLAKRASAVDENWIKPVALWSGAVTTDAQGHATVKMEVPEFSGQLRLVAVAASATATGAQSKNIFVRRPFVLQTSLPRFLLPSDKFTAHVSLFNNSDTPAKAVVGWTTEGTITVASGTKEMDVAAHKEAALTVDFAAANAIGQGKIRWYAAFQGPDGKELDRVTQDMPLPVRQPAAYQSDREMIVLKAGETTTIRNTKFIEDERTEVSVTVGASPELRLYHALKYVVGYPYGCVEQTTSRCFPMYLLRRSEALNKIAIEKSQTVEGYLQAGIDRLFSMQTTEGGLGFWPGAESPYAYGSVYALHFLTLVKAGRDLPLPDESFKALQNYVRGVSRDWSQNGESALFLRAYATYVLALDGDLDAIKQIQRFDSLKLPRPARLLLAAALAINTKDKERVKMYLSSAPSVPYQVTEMDGTLSSDIRNQAIELLAMRQMGSDPKEIADKAEVLIAWLTKNTYGTTQETAFVVSALAEYMGDIANTVTSAAATVSAPDGQKAIKALETYRGVFDGPGRVFTIANTGSTNLYINATTRGVPQTVDTSAVAKGLTVARAVFDEHGKPFEGTTYKQGDSYIIGVTLTPDRALKNVVLADLLPAGFEVENPRLQTDGLPEETFKDAVTPTYLDVRDDRMVAAFNDLPQGEHRFFYIVRAVTPGTYQYPGAEAECMYDVSVLGHSAAGSMDVKGR